MLELGRYVHHPLIEVFEIQAVYQLTEKTPSLRSMSETKRDPAPYFEGSF